MTLNFKIIASSCGVLMSLLSHRTQDVAQILILFCFCFFYPKLLHLHDEDILGKIINLLLKLLYECQNKGCCVKLL